METFGNSESLPSSAPMISSGRKRGRPRKYGPNGAISVTPSPVTTALSDSSVESEAIPAPPVSSVAPVWSPMQTSPASSAQQPNVRPPASGRKKRTPTSVERIGIPGCDYKAHTIYAKPGEDLVIIIMDFVRNCTGFVHVSSAVGALSSAVLLHPTPNGSRTAYEGQFEIAELKGTFMSMEKDGTRSMNGRLAISLSDTNNQLRAGRVSGPLTAATNVQIIMCSFKIDDQEKSELEKHMEPFYAITVANPMNVGETESLPAGQAVNESPGHAAADGSNQD